MKKFAKIAAGLLLVLALVGCGRNVTNNDEPVGVTEDGFVYQNDLLDFRLTFPKSWGDQVFDERQNVSDLPIEKRVHFTTRENPEWFVTIDVVDKTNRAELDGAEGYEGRLAKIGPEFAYYIIMSDDGDTKKIRKSLVTL